MTQLEQRCLDAGMKMTHQRRIVLQALVTSEDHPSVEQVHERARELDPSISIATVYRTLTLLDEMNLVQRHEFGPETFARFEANLEHHHHLIDVETGGVIEFQNEALERLKVQIADDLGYDLVDHRLELYAKKHR